MRRAMPILLALPVLAGCTAADRPMPPEAAITAPQGWHSDLAGIDSVDSQWWRRFGDPALAHVVESALAHNPDIGIAVARVREARAQLRLAGAALLPTVDASMGASHGRSLNALGEAVESTVAQPIAQISYEIDLFGRIDDQVSAARSAWMASAAARDAARLSVSATTASAYVTLLGLDAQREVVRDTIRARSEALRLARSRAESGYTSQLELRQAEAEYQAAAVILPQVETGAVRAENALRLLMGELPGPIERGGTLTALAVPPVPDIGLPSQLLRRRPDIAQAELSLAATDASLSAARKQFLPSLRLNASGGGVFNNLLPDPVTIWSIGGSILAPIFEGGRLSATVDASAAKRDQAAFSYRKVTLSAFREVEDALASVSGLARQRVAAEGQRIAVADALRHATNRYQAGYSGYLEQLDAQRALLSTELTLVQLRVDQMNALISLYAALGGGWQEVGEGRSNLRKDETP